HVTDFLAYGNLFIGNLADVILGVGVALGLLLYLRGPHHTRNEQ
ncbi:MAG: signal peptidase II, partial [Actinobacteria bacterium]|nr:signal peptidase II [Actinomycetota bacterium]